MLTIGTLLIGFWHYPHGNAVAGILAGGTVIFLLGVVDDLYNLSPYVKLAGQFVAALLAFYMGVQVNTLDLPESLLLVLHSLSLPVTVLWLVGISNAINLIDGVDGLAGGVITLSAITLATIAVFTDQPVAALLAAILAGVNLGFLVYNFHPACIFMGDSGALFSGFTLGCIAVTGVLKTKVVVMLVVVMIFILPIADISIAVFRRLLQGKNPFKPDAEHIHHKLLRAGLGPVKTVVYLYGACIAAGMLVTGYVNYLWNYLLLIVCACLLATVLIRARKSLHSDLKP